MGNEVRGLLNPLLVHPSASPPYPHPIRSSAYPPPFCVPFARSPIRRPSTACLPPIHPPATVRLSAPRPPPSTRLLVRPSPLVRPRLPRPRLPKITFRFLLLQSFLPLVRHMRLPREIATFAILGANRSHNGIGVRKFPPLCGQP